MSDAGLIEQTALIDERVSTVIDGVMIGSQNDIDAGEEIQLFGARAEVEKIIALVDIGVADGRDRAQQIDDAQIGVEHGRDVFERLSIRRNEIHTPPDIDIASKKYFGAPARRHDIYMKMGGSLSEQSLRRERVP